jgi:hypothetical protein
MPNSFAAARRATIQPVRKKKKERKEKKERVAEGEGRTDRKLVGGNSKLFAYHAKLSRLLLLFAPKQN